MLRDATLTAIALSRFRRQRDRWPDDLQELVPSYMETLLPDRYDGLPLRYAICDGVPVLYALGRDLDDDGGTPAENPTEAEGRFGISSNSGAPDGDWILWPPLPREEDDD
jgi:hypothetical protein